MAGVTEVYRAPMRSRSDDVDPQGAIDRALRRSVCGFGQIVTRPADEQRLARRVDRFAAIADGSFVWTRDADGLFWLGRIDGPYFYDDDAAAAAVDLVHVRPCVWVPTPLPESELPAAVIATFGRGGRNFQQTHDPTVGSETGRLWSQRH
jgi:hypothetical protein